MLHDAGARKGYRRGHLDAIKNDKSQLVQLGLLAADLLKADFLGYLAREFDLPGRVLALGWVAGVLEVQGREEGLGRISGARWADKGCRRRRLGSACKSSLSIMVTSW
jgi:hypothetical protein